MKRAAALGCVATVAVTVAACGGGTNGGATATGSSAGGQRNGAAYCNQVRQFLQSTASVQSNPDQIRTVFASWDKVTAAAPSAIAPSAQAINSAYHKILSKVGSTDLKQNPQALQTAANDALNGQQKQLQTASQQVTDYTKRTCNIDLSGSSGSTTSTKP